MPSLFVGRGIPDYSKRRAPVSCSDQGHDAKESLPGVMPPQRKNSFKAKKARSLSFSMRRERSLKGLRGGLRRERSVAKGLGFGVHRENSMSRCLGLQSPTAVILEGGNEEVQFRFPRRPRTRRDRRQGEGRLKVVYDAQKPRTSLAPLQKSRKSSIFHRTPSSIEDKDSERISSNSPTSVVQDEEVINSPIKIRKEDQTKLRTPMRASSGDNMIMRMQLALRAEALSPDKEKEKEKVASPRRTLRRTKSSDEVDFLKRAESRRTGSVAKCNSRHPPRRTKSIDRGTPDFATDLHFEPKYTQSQRKLNVFDKNNVHPIVGNQQLNRELKKTQSQRRINVVDKTKVHPVLANNMKSFRNSETDHLGIDTMPHIVIELDPESGSGSSSAEVNSGTITPQIDVEFEPYSFMKADSSGTVSSESVEEDGVYTSSPSDNKVHRLGVSGSNKKTRRGGRHRGGRVRALIKMLGIH